MGKNRYTYTLITDWPTSGMCIGKGMWEFIRAYLPEGSNILELGAGWGTKKLAENYKMHTIEDNAKWVTPYVGVSDIIHAPIKIYDDIYKIPVTDEYFDENEKSFPDEIWGDITSDNVK